MANGKNYGIVGVGPRNMVWVGKRNIGSKAKNQNKIYDIRQ